MVQKKSFKLNQMVLATLSLFPATAKLDGAVEYTVTEGADLIEVISSPLGLAAKFVPVAENPKAGLVKITATGDARQGPEIFPISVEFELTLTEEEVEQIEGVLGDPQPIDRSIPEDPVSETPQG